MISRVNRLLAASSLVTVTLSSAAALGQVTSPLVPAPPPPSGPEATRSSGQPIGAGETVTSRARPEYDALGLRLGSFFLFPRAEIDQRYDDNIFATNADTTSDFITVVQPSFDITSNFRRNAINFHAGTAIRHYLTHSSEDTDDGFASVDGRLDLAAHNAFYGRVELAHGHEARSSPTAPGNAAEPVQFDTYGAHLEYRRTGRRIGYRADLAANRHEYYSVPEVGGGVLEQSSRNLTIYEGALRGDYEISPDHELYLRFSENFRNYDHTLAPGITQDSQGFRADVGLEFLPSGPVYGNIYTGYLRQAYNSSLFGVTSGVDAGGYLVWNITRLTTLKFRALRSVDEGNLSVIHGSPGYVHSEFSASVDHETLRNLIMSMKIDYSNDNFSGITRNDDIISADLSVKYLMNRHLFLDGSYTFLKRDSSGSDAANPFTQNIMMVRIGTQF